MNMLVNHLEFVRNALLVLMFCGYVGICLWAFAPRNRQRFRDAAHIPLDGDTP